MAIPMQTRGETGVSVTAAQAGQDEQGLPTEGQATPAQTDPTAVTCERTGEMPQSTAGQIDALGSPLLERS
ncbi:hypothetical protein [Streptomyces sp. PBSH9]